ncbi:DUF4158 domain-containing protein [Neorhizobium galegae]|uniref:DUF4158 domain-containing protein n=1 Tax=Neorhizobium galegae TaxID=399 RepID=A0A6A1TKA7_NEOGA|nr:DUF4158 domain-containing protein [Neorhizobium galegae]
MVVNGIGRWQSASFSKIKIAGSLSISQSTRTALIRHYSFSLADRLEIELRRRNHNRLGFASGAAQDHARARF